MFYTLHNSASGTLLDISTTGFPQQADHQIQCFDGDVPDLYSYQWDKESLQFKRKVDIERRMTVLQFLNRFTAIERIAIKSAALTDPALSDYMDMLYQASYVDPDSQEIYGGLYYLSILGLIQQSRISEILA